MPPAARLHILLASEADYAVIIRRGPSKRVCTIGWDRTNDTFTVGQCSRAASMNGEATCLPMANT